MTRIPIHCMKCGIELKNELDTYGNVGQELCADCWYEWEEEQNGVSYYGLAPHIHDESITGSMIGSTVFLDYSSARRDEHGRYWIEDRKMWFTPDNEVDGSAGMWDER